MCLMSIFTVLAAVINLVSCKDGGVTFEVNIPSIFNQLLNINQSLNTLRASVGYDGKGTLENSLDLVSNNPDNPGETLDQRRSDNNSTNSTDFNFIKVDLRGLDDVASALKVMRRAGQVHPDFLYQANLKKKEPVNPPRGAKFLKKMRRINRMRKQMNAVSNVGEKDASRLKIRFPQLYKPQGLRRSRAKVEMDHGVINTEIITYRPNHLRGRLKHLIKLKKKQDKEEATRLALQSGFNVG